MYREVYTIYIMTKELSDKDKKAFALIRNKLVHYGESPSLREINEITGGKSPRSASLVIDRLVDQGLITKGVRGVKLANTQARRLNSISTVMVPLVGNVACGVPIFAEENVEALIPVSIDLAKKTSTYFLLRVNGDSMNLAGINNGDLVLVRKQDTADSGDKVVALINEEATVKIFERANGLVILKPKSNNETHKPIILTDNCIIQGVVVAILPADVY